MSVELAHVIRGGRVECVHRGDLVVADLEGNILYSLGDPYKATYWRSSAKPFQLIPLIEAGGIERFGFTEEELAVMAASHGGEERHVEKVRDIFKKLGCSPELLDCGTASPMYYPAAKEVLKKGKAYTPLHNNCSGKHSAMIALALLKGYPVEGYIKPGHPVQQDILEVVSDITGMDREEIGIGVDGCGVPVFYMPLLNMAKAYAILSKPEGVQYQSRKAALRIIGEAMTRNPYYVAGTDRLDTCLMEATGGKVVAKLGAEAVYCIGIMGRGIGIALKIEDGNIRAIGPVAVELLRKHGFITSQELELLMDWWEVPIKNHRKEVIGVIKAVI